jgi:hypothetical protein
MRTLRNCLSVVLGVAVAAAVLVVTGAGPDAAKGANQAKEQAYEANFECAIPAGSANCTVAADKEIPAGKRLRVESVKARIVMPTATKTFEFYVELGDPSAPGGVRAMHVVPESAGKTEGGFYNIYAANEKVQAFAYRTASYPAPKVHLENPSGDPMHLQNGTIQDGVLSGFLVDMN